MKTGAILPAGPDPAEFAPGTATRPDVIYFFGDSITLGWRDESLGGWPVRLLRGLHAEGHAATGYNLGIRGDTSTKIADRWEDEVRRRRRDGHRHMHRVRRRRNLVKSGSYSDSIVVAVTY